MTQWTDAILDYRKPSAEDRRAPRWAIRLLLLAAIVAFPCLYALFVVALIVSPLLIVLWPAAQTVGLGFGACLLTGGGTLGALWVMDYCIDRT